MALIYCTGLPFGSRCCDIIVFFFIFFSFFYSKTEYLRKLILIQIYLKVLLCSHCKSRTTTLGSVDLSWVEHTLQRGRRLEHAGLNLMLELNKQYHSKTLYFKNLQAPTHSPRYPHPIVHSTIPSYIFRTYTCCPKEQIKINFFSLPSEETKPSSSHYLHIRIN